ncbi:recombinase family protein [Flavobacteriaceae bacterium]|jgi:DNA invertase Pin-like site-specific DNA recombinase|nr:recombinase family protein [Polaribacter sp.]MDB9993434.1 recombinase family protein [Flavobacteriaceae bacterium]
MKVKYNRVSTILQTGNRFEADTDTYDITLLDKVSGSVSFKNRIESKKLVNLVENGKVTELVTEEFSRLGRNTGDVISTLDWLDQNKVNVRIRNLGIESRPNGKRNPVWKILSATISSLYEMELENIKERTSTGRMIYLQNGGILGRPKNTTESNNTFLSKPKSKKIIHYLEIGLSIREIAKQVNASPKTIMKVKRLL